MVNTYAVLSDFHAPQLIEDGIVEDIAASLSTLGVAGIVLNGDIGESATFMPGDEYRPTPIREDYMLRTIEPFAKTGKPVFIQPGNHEDYDLYTNVVSFLTAKYPNVIDAINEPSHKMGDHKIVFLPGCADWISSFEHTVDYPTGSYIRRMVDGKAELIPATDNNARTIELNQQLKTAEFAYTPMDQVRMTNVNDLETLVGNGDPAKVVLFTHSPAKQSTQPSVDTAPMIELSDGKLAMPGQVASLYHQQFGDQSKDLMEAHIASGKLKRIIANRGYGPLTDVLQATGVNKVVSGHFHGCAGNAVDSAGQPVAAEKLVSNLHWCASYMNNIKFGLLDVNGSEVAYRNIQPQ